MKMVPIEHRPENASPLFGNCRPLKRAPSRLREWARFALLTLLTWTAVSLFQAIPDMIDGFRWSELVAKVGDAWAWALLTPAILAVDRRVTDCGPSVSKLVCSHLLLSVPFNLVHLYLTGVLLYPFPEITWNPLRVSQFAIYFYMGGWVTYCALVAAVQAFNFHKRLINSQLDLERAESRLVMSRLNVLRLQLEPHFLFNTLNAISSELATQPQLAREMIEDLAALLRQSLDCQGRTEITLAQELGLLGHYVAIQQLRFGDRLNITVEADPEMYSAMVPSMLLQPLVENAIRHGLEGRMSGGEIVVSARHRGAELRIEVSDDGVGLPVRWRMDTHAGLGIQVTRERLQALYPDAGERAFVVTRRRGGGTKVAVRIPVRCHEPDSHG